MHASVCAKKMREADRQEVHQGNIIKVSDSGASCIAFLDLAAGFEGHLTSQKAQFSVTSLHIVLFFANFAAKLDIQKTKEPRRGGKYSFIN